MRFTYSPTFKDYWALNLYALFPHWRLCIRLATVLLALGVIAPWVWTAFDVGLPPAETYKGVLPTFILMLGCFLLMILAMYAAARMGWAATRELREPREYEIDDSGVRVKAAGSEGFVEWPGIVDTSVTNRFVYLVTAQQQYYSTSFNPGRPYFNIEKHYYYFPISTVPDMGRLRELIRTCVNRARDKQTA
jgi:hypothetical protein